MNNVHFFNHFYASKTGDYIFNGVTCIRVVKNVGNNHVAAGQPPHFDKSEFSAEEYVGYTEIQNGNEIDREIEAIYSK